ncbi:MAG: hypothetical protein ACI9IT_002194, partial [Glaciecola sp.]
NIGSENARPTAASTYQLRVNGYIFVSTDSPSTILS